MEDGKENRGQMAGVLAPLLGCLDKEEQKQLMASENGAHKELITSRWELGIRQNVELEEGLERRRNETIQKETCFSFVLEIAMLL